MNPPVAHVPGTPETAVECVPASVAERGHLRSLAVRYVQEHGLLPPLGVDELRGCASSLAAQQGVPGEHLAFLTVLIGNAVWQPVVAAVPFDRRLLLLPQCLCRTEVCRAERDEVGLLCAGCGRCSIARLQGEAERLGYVTLVAEGTTVVRKLILGGKIDAIVGVGCLASLERVLPDMCTHAIPGLGIPLLRDGCRTTDLDEEWLLDVLRLRAVDGADLLRDLESLRQEVDAWFDRATLDTLLGAAVTHVERVGRAWLSRGGKRWRPLLTAGVFSALAERDTTDDIRAAGVAVECFHKASLVHDDIEDSDDIRYGQPTVHREQGVPIAINVGDYLIGEGYRLLTAMPVAAPLRIRLFEAAVRGHLMLCQGQGEELAFDVQPRRLSLAETARICERKTAAAFEVAIAFGAIGAGADDEVCVTLGRFSRAIGIAYQIRDDLEDYAETPGRPAAAVPLRPNILFGLACESGEEPLRQALNALLAQPTRAARDAAWHALVLASPSLFLRARQLLEHHRHEAERAVAGLHHSGLRVLLRRVAARVLASTPAS